jgi:site-specific DNA-adenine methylase
MKPNLKTPISYYGGKQSMLQHIVPLAKLQGKKIDERGLILPDS